MTTAHQLDAGNDGIREYTCDEGEALLDARARQLLGISGPEFRRRWAAGEYDGQEERDEVWQVAFLLGGAFKRT
ncbi:MAG: hypothetical protein IT303_04225 [Dehalococcoidia bacterium]|nr:hypothetical protein [Dehalococcoidia bacterium]